MPARPTFSARDRFPVGSDRIEIRRAPLGRRPNGRFLRRARDVAGSPPFQGWRELHLRGLEEDSAHQLLLSLAKAPVQRRVAAELVVAAGGNPLALRGFVHELSPSQLAGLSALPDPLPTGHLIEARFARQAEALPRDTRTALLLAAEPSGDPVTIAAAASELGIALTSLEPAEAIQLIRMHPGIEFSHPLVRSAVYSSASLIRRREVHQALASATDRSSDGERWAMHRALASLGPDEGVALALEDSAAQARKRGGYSAETTLLVRSADLTPELRQRSDGVSWPPTLRTTPVTHRWPKAFSMTCVAANSTRSIWHTLSFWTA